MPVTHTANEPNNFPQGVSSEEDLDARARKRLEVGLSPRRPTAKAAPQRPPDYPSLPVSPLALSLLLIVVLLVTALLVAANLTGWTPTGWLARFDTPELVGQPAPGAPLAGEGYALRLAEDFSSASSTLLQGEQRQEWRTELLPAESVYRFQVWPDHLAWSLLGLDDVTHYRLQTGVVVDAASPGGYAGLIARYQDERHFYLLAVDGEGRYWVQLQDGDTATTLQPWTPADFLNKAGTANMLTLEDTGAALRFYANGMLLYEITSPRYAPGHVGLAGGAQGSDVAQLRFDWLQFFDAAE